LVYSFEHVQKISEEDENAFRFFMAKEAPARRTLADIIMEKLAEKKGEIDMELADDKSKIFALRKFELKANKEVVC
jgi:hypothetical protein